MRMRDRPDSGYSLIELVAVVAVLGVLAAIAVPVYLGAQASAKEAAVQGDLQNARLAITAYAARHDGDVPAAVTRDGAASGPTGTADLRTDGWSRSAATTDLLYTRAGVSWCLVATASTGEAFSIAPGTAVRRAAGCV